MTFDRKDFMDSRAVREVRAQREMMPLIRTLQGAAPVMSALITGYEPWDKYQSILSGFAERLKAAHATAIAKLADPSIWEPYQLAKLKADVLTVGAMLEMLQTAMELPKAILAGGIEADEMVKQFESKHEQPAGNPES